MRSAVEPTLVGDQHGFTEAFRQCRLHASHIAAWSIESNHQENQKPIDFVRCRHVVLPNDIAALLPKGRLLSEVSDCSMLAELDASVA